MAVGRGTARGHEAGAGEEYGAGRHACNYGALERRQNAASHRATGGSAYPLTATARPTRIQALEMTPTTEARLAVSARGEVWTAGLALLLLVLLIPRGGPAI